MSIKKLPTISFGAGEYVVYPTHGVGKVSDITKQTIAGSELELLVVNFDKEKGLYAIPFYETFTQIFEGKEVEGKNECVKYFLTNDSIPDTILERVSAKYKNFMQVVNEVLEKEYTFEELIKEYKSEYLKNRLYSSATVLYCSNAFSSVFDVISAPKPEAQVSAVEKVGRNEPCPCGSGKKFKNCCGKN